MIGFFNSSSTFSLVAIRALQDNADELYITPIDDNILWQTSYDGSVYIDIKTSGHELRGADSNGNEMPSSMVGRAETIVEAGSYGNQFNYVMNLPCPGGGDEEEPPVPCDLYTDYVETRIDTGLTIPSTDTTTALYMKYIKDDTSYVSDTRNQYIFRADDAGDVYNKLDQGYIKQKQFISFTGAGSQTWCLPWEWKQTSDNYGRFGIYIYGLDATPYWYAQSQELNSGIPGTILFSETNNTTPVPLGSNPTGEQWTGEWFDIEIFWVGSADPLLGKIQVACNGVLIFDITCATKRAGSDNITYYMMKDKIYGKPGEIMVTDCIWAKEPIAGSVLSGSGDSPQYYPVGAIPSGEGSGIYTYGGSLVTFSPTLIDTYYTHVATTQDEVIYIENYEAVNVLATDGLGSYASASISAKGTVGMNQTVVIRGNKVTDINHRGIWVKGFDNVIIEGNYIENVKRGISIGDFKNASIKYNKIKNHAVGTYNPLVGHHSITANGGYVANGYTVESFEVAYNLVDRSDAPYGAEPLSNQERNDAAMASDYMNIKDVVMSTGKIGEVHNNIQMGSEHIGEVATGCAYILDDANSGVKFTANIGVNCTQTAYGSANSSGEWVDNIGHYTYLADFNLTLKHEDDPADVITGPYKTRVIGMGYYTGGYNCDEVRPETRSGPHILTGNRGARDPNTTFVGSIDSEISRTYVDGSNTDNVLTGNSFGWRTDDATEPHDVIFGEGAWCETDAWNYYLDYLNTVDANPPLPTTNEEVFQLIGDMTYVRGMATNGAMFSKWGTADNNEMYFDESRTI